MIFKFVIFKCWHVIEFCLSSIRFILEEKLEFICFILKFVLAISLINPNYLLNQTCLWAIQASFIFASSAALVSQASFVKI